MTIPQYEYTIHVGHVIWLTMVVSNGSQYDYFGSKWNMFLVQIVMCIAIHTNHIHMYDLSHYTQKRPFPQK